MFEKFSSKSFFIQLKALCYSRKMPHWVDRTLDAREETALLEHGSVHLQSPLVKGIDTVPVFDWAVQAFIAPMMKLISLKTLSRARTSSLRDPKMVALYHVLTH